MINLSELTLHVAKLYNKDSKETFQNFKDMLALSESENALYPFFDDFLLMISSDKYLIRLKGFKLLCKQSQWDIEQKIDKNIDLILSSLPDQKPTAVRTKIQALKDIVEFKPQLKSKIANNLKLFDISAYSDNMLLLIEKDILAILCLI